MWQTHAPAVIASGNAARQSRAARTNPAASFPSPLRGEGGAKRRMRGCAKARIHGQSPPSPQPSPQRGEGVKKAGSGKRLTNPHNPKLIDAPQTSVILVPPFHNTGAGATNVRGEKGPGSLGVASGKAKTVPRPACPRWQVYFRKGAGMDPSASKSTGHAKNPGCMRRCMSHCFTIQTGHAPSHAACVWTP